MMTQFSFPFAPRPRLRLCDIELILKKRGTRGLKGVSRDWLYRMCESGEWDAVKREGLWLVYADSFCAWLAEDEGFEMKDADINKMLGIQAIAA